jgi:isoleucyl-tRNA synthetase
VDGALVDDKLAEQVALVRRTVELGRAARAESKVRGRQPLGRALVGAPGWAALPEDLKREVAEELNVLSFEELAGELVNRSVKGNFRSLGKRFGKDTPKVAAAVAATDATALAAALRDEGRATVLVDGEEVSLAPEDVVLTETPREGWAVVTASGETVALDLTMTEALRRAGLAREVVRLVQEARKAAGFEVSDRIALVWSAEDETAAAIETHLATICDEVLAVTAERGTPVENGWLTRDSDLGLTFSVTRSEQ